MLAAVLLGSSVWAQEPGHYTIELDGWDSNQYFDFTPNPANLNTGDFTNPDSFCTNYLFCDDPSIRLNGGGGSTPESGEFSFNSGGGTETLDFQNTGAPIDEVLITLTDQYGNPIPLPADELDELFICSSDIFQKCGFDNDAFQIAFWDPYSSNGVGIPTASPVPEPSFWALLLFAFGAAVVVRARKNSAIASFARTER
jgi:PEP-CTERM motif